MKNLLLIILTIVFTSCKAQKITTMKKFDIETFNKHKDSIRYEYNRTSDDGTVIKQSESTDFYDENIKSEKSYFQKINRYHKNGNLKLTGEYLYNSYKKGIWKEYDQDGKLIKETDYDKGFDYTWEDLLKLLKEREVDIKNTRDTDIRKDEGKWRIWYIKGLYIYNIHIDGKTGKIIDDSKNEFDEGS
ncbi:conserved hypothetical protein [Tenacibaculum maritimum]|nr:conserved hypothetical protein [Tenacibaculum maritimum]